MEAMKRAVQTEKLDGENKYSCERFVVFDICLFPMGFDLLLYLIYVENYFF